MSDLQNLNENILTGGCQASDCASCSGCGSSGSVGVGDHRTITLTMEDDTEVECAILTVFPIEDREYIALLPLDENGQNKDGEVYLYKFTRTEKGDPILSNIDSDEEYNQAAIAFDTIIQNAQSPELAFPAAEIPKE